MISHNPISKLNELASFYGMTRSEVIQALIEREHEQLLTAVKKSDRPWLFFEQKPIDVNYSQLKQASFEE